MLIAWVLPPPEVDAGGVRDATTSLEEWDKDDLVSDSTLPTPGMPGDFAAGERTEPLTPEDRTPGTFADTSDQEGTT